MRHDKFLYANKGSTKSLSNDGGRTKRGLTDWAYRTSTHEASPSRSTAKGVREGFAQNPYLENMNLIRQMNGLSKPTDHVGQQRNDKFMWELSQLISVCFIELNFELS